jgi:hypothetical protein
MSPINQPASLGPLEEWSRQVPGRPLVPTVCAREAIHGRAPAAVERVSTGKRRYNKVGSVGMAYPCLPACIWIIIIICGRPLELWPPGAVVPLRDGGLRV